jgi:hypothetical protein
VPGRRSGSLTCPWSNQVVRTNLSPQDNVRAIDAAAAQDMKFDTEGRIALALAGSRKTTIYKVRLDGTVVGRFGTAGKLPKEFGIGSTIYGRRRDGTSSRTTPAARITPLTIGGTRTPFLSAFCTWSGPASMTVSRSVQNSPPQSSATTPIVVSTAPII